VLPRLIATDLDGTLLRPDGTLSDRTAAALQAVAAEGVTVVFATGRPPFIAAREIAAAGSGVHYGVMANGAIVCTLPAVEVLHSVSFSAAIAREAVRVLRLHDPALGFAFATDRGFTAEAGFHERMPVHAGNDTVADALSGHDDATEAIKLFAFHPTRGAHALTEELPAVLGPSLTVSHMGAEAVEIAPAGVDKGVGLQWLLDHLGVDGHDVMVFGDEINDLPMFAVAGRRVAVQNANPAVRDAADEVTESNADDGVAVVIERLLATARHP
jgi:Cof subfamily protein (haloacid dehalogenase superfamily)